MTQKNWFWILLTVVIFLVVLAGGVIYWTFFKAKKITDSVIDSSQKSPSILTPSSSGEATSTPTPEVLPTADIDGEDISGINRYRDSVRIEFDKNDDSSVINVGYMAKETGQNILEYYKSDLVNKGWIIRAEDSSSLSFSNSEADLSIEITSENKVDMITQYLIHYIKITPIEE